MSDSKQEGLLGRPVSRRQVLAGGLAAGAAAFVAAAGSSSALAQSPSPSPVPTPVPSGDGSFSGTMLQGFSGGYSMPAENIGLAAWAGATGGNATFTNVPFTEKPEVIAAMISTQDSNWDSIYTNDNFMARFGARLLTPTTDWYTADDLSDFYPSAIATYTATDGVLRGLPIHYDGYASGYNQDLFDKIGVSTPPTTWAELFALTPKFVAAGIIPSIQPWLATDGTFGAFYWKQIYNSLAHPMFSDDRTQLMFDGPEGLKAFQTVEDGLKSGFWDADVHEPRERAQRVRRVQQGQRRVPHRGCGLRARGRLRGREVIQAHRQPGHRPGHHRLGQWQRRPGPQQVQRPAACHEQLPGDPVLARRLPPGGPGAPALRADADLGAQQRRCPGVRRDTGARVGRAVRRARSTCGARPTTTPRCSTT